MIKHIVEIQLYYTLLVLQIAAFFENIIASPVSCTTREQKGISFFLEMAQKTSYPRFLELALHVKYGTIPFNKQFYFV